MHESHHVHEENIRRGVYLDKTKQQENVFERGKPKANDNHVQDNIYRLLERGVREYPKSHHKIFQELLYEGDAKEKIQKQVRDFRERKR